MDIRPSAAYNGWQLKGESRGGHIRGAVSFPLSWGKDLSHFELKTILQTKGIVPEKTVVIYDYKDENYSDIVELLRDFGCRKVLVYAAGIQEWSANPALPMERLANFEKLVYPEWVDQFVSKTKPSLFEASYEGQVDYRTGHIPGAIHFDLSALEGPPLWNLCPDDELLAFLLAQGITYQSSVVLYGRDTMAAARAACILMYAGVEDVRILDGGLDAWLRAGYVLEMGEQHPLPVDDFGRKIPAHPEYIIDMDGAKALLADEQGLLVSVRSWDEYIGKTSGYDYIKPKGRIAGAVWGHSGSDAHQMQDYCNPDHTMRAFPEIEANLREAGITADKKVAFYCGTGWRASEAFLCAYLMGRQNIAVYDGGWLEWSLNKSNPIERGIPNLSD